MFRKRDIKNAMMLLLILGSVLHCNITATCKDEILVYTPSDFTLIERCPNSKFLLMNNITVVGPMPMIPIFKGTFDGQGFYIGGIVLSELYDKAALFDTFSGSMRNVTISSILDISNSKAKFISGFAIELTDAYFYDVSIVTNIRVQNCTPGSIIGGALSSTSETSPGLNVSSSIIVMDCECIVGGAIGQLDNNYTTLLPSYWSSPITVNSIIKLYNSSSIVGGYIGVSKKNIHSLTLVSSIEVLGNQNHECCIGGVVANLTGSVVHSKVVLNKIYVSGCKNTEGSIIGGLGTYISCNFPNCTIVEDIKLYVDLFYTNGLSKAYVGGGFGYLDRVSLSYIYFSLMHVEVESRFGGIAASINCTSIDQSSVSVDYITWINSTTDPFLIGGFGATVENYTTIKNSMVKVREIDLNYTSASPSYFGGFVANASKLLISNSYGMIGLAVLNTTETVGDNSSFGILLGRITCIAEERMQIISSFVAADTILVNGHGSKIFNVGGFVGYLTDSASNKQCFMLANSWASIKFRINEIRKACKSPFAVGALIGNPGESSFTVEDIYIKVYFDIVNIQKYLYDDDDNRNKHYNAIGLLTGFYAKGINGYGGTDMSINKVICQVEILFTEEFEKQIYYAPTAPECSTCKDIIITNTSSYLRGFSSKAATLADPEKMEKREFYTSFIFGTDQIWQYNLDVYPYHTSLPFLVHHLSDHISDGNSIRFVTPMCNHHLCWNYSHIWSAQRSMENLELQYEANHCNVHNCILCYPSSPHICMTCASGYISNASGDTCLACHNSCMKCTTPDLKNKCTSCAIYGQVLHNGMCAANTYTCSVPHCLLCDFTNAQTCSVCVPGKGVQAGSGYCNICNKDCYTCSLSQSCTSCNNYTNEALSGLCEYTTRGCYNTCKFCKEKDNEICLKCNDLSYILDEYGNCQKRPIPFCMVYNCAVCSSVDNYICNVCNPGYYLTKDRVCKACDVSCSVCSSYSVCLECMNSEIKPIGGICNYSNNCTISGCFTCTLGVEPVCLLCNTGYVLTDNKCQELIDHRLKQVKLARLTAIILTVIAISINVAYPLVRYRKYLKEEHVSLQLDIS